jgi:hypothetical protein
MKKKVKMTCILKSGRVIKDQLRGDSEIIKVTEVIRKNVEDYFAEPDKYKRDAGVLGFGKTTIFMSEIAAISFKD